MVSRRLIRTTLTISVLLLLLRFLSSKSAVRNSQGNKPVEDHGDNHETSVPQQITESTNSDENTIAKDFDLAGGDEPLIYRNLFSLTTKDREYMRVYMGSEPAYNLNVIPHPSNTEFWILTGQHAIQTPFTPSEHITCAAGIQNDFFLCASEVTVLPLMAQGDGACEDTTVFMPWVWGSRDARVFYGPHAPYVTYGAQSDGNICFAQWLQDFRVLLKEFAPRQPSQHEAFQKATEMQRPSGGRIEKNYFVFWDTEGVPYAHYSIWPKRAFSRLTANGSPSPDLAEKNTYEDQMCLAKFLPPQRRFYQQDLHQATNSLSITLCKRSQGCTVSDSNTFIMHIFHLKTFDYSHPEYEPFVMLFKRNSPFGVHAVGQRPYWIHGRGNLTEASGNHFYKNNPGLMPQGETELFYITSMSWKSHMQTYHGYLDDVLFLSFGIEDAKGGVIDILAGDLLQDLAFC